MIKNTKHFLWCKVSKEILNSDSNLYVLWNLKTGYSLCCACAIFFVLVDYSYFSFQSDGIMILARPRLFSRKAFEGVMADSVASSSDQTPSNTSHCSRSAARKEYDKKGDASKIFLFDAFERWRELKNNTTSSQTRMSQSFCLKVTVRKIHYGVKHNTATPSTFYYDFLLLCDFLLTYSEFFYVFSNAETQTEITMWPLFGEQSTPQGPQTRSRSLMYDSPSGKSC